MSNYTLLDHQRQIADFIYKNPRCAIFVGMGYGKTLSTLAALEALRPPGNILIVAPKNIARATWIDEINKWQIPVSYRSLIVNDKGKKLTPKLRKERYEEVLTSTPKMYFINIDLLKDLITYYQAKKVDFPFHTVVIDESQTLKNPSSARFKALRSVANQIQRIILLTGTPIPNGYEDLWSQVFLLDFGQRLGKTLTLYRSSYFYPTVHVDGRPVAYELRSGMEDVINDTVKDLCLSTKTDLKLPSLTINDVKVYLDDAAYAKYKDFKNDLVLDLSENLEDQVTASNAAILRNKLLQFATGLIYKEEFLDDKGQLITPDTAGGVRDYHKVHEAKLEMLDYIVTDTPTPILLAYRYKSELKEILARYPQAEAFDGTPETIARWNNKQIPMLCIHPASAGHGLNLQQGGSTLVWFSLPDSSEHYEQTNARLHRMGQTEPVIIHRLITQKTIDQLQPVMLERKGLTQQELIAAVIKELRG